MPGNEFMALQFNSRQVDLLNEPIPRSVIKGLPKAGKTFDYLEHHYVTRRLNEIFGPGGWCMEVVRWDIRRQENARGVGAVAQVRLTFAGGLVKDGIGYGTGLGSGFDAEDQAIKSAVSDGLKVAAYRLGDALGLALYDKEQERVVEESSPQSDSTKDSSVLERIKASTSVDQLTQIWLSFSVPERARYSEDLRARRDEIEGGRGDK